VICTESTFPDEKILKIQIWPNYKSLQLWLRLNFAIASYPFAICFSYNYDFTSPLLFLRKLANWTLRFNEPTFTFDSNNGLRFRVAWASNSLARSHTWIFQLFALAATFSEAYFGQFLSMRLLKYSKTQDPLSLPGQWQQSETNFSELLFLEHEILLWPDTWVSTVLVSKRTSS
jgi:hypothetical protein